MPHFWIRISMGTPERLKPYVDDPQGFEAELDAIAAECGGGLDATFFAKNERSAFALIHDASGTLDVTRLEELLSDARGKPARVDLETPEERARRTRKS